MVIRQLGINITRVLESLHSVAYICILKDCRRVRGLCDIS